MKKAKQFPYIGTNVDGAPFSHLNFGFASDGDVWLLALESNQSPQARNILLQVPDGNVGVGTDDPQSKFSVTGDVRIEEGSLSSGACLIMKDSDGDGYTYVTVNDGVLSASTDPCN